MRNDTKRKFGTLFFASAIVFFGHWFDFFNMIKPGARETMIEMEAHHHDVGYGDGEHATMSAADYGENQAGDHTAAGHDDHAANDHAEAGNDDGPAGADYSEADHGDGREILPYKAGFTFPGLLEVGIFLGFLGGFLFFVLYSLSKAPLEPKRDPYFEESLHHHT
jgi:hypothetical protein